MMRLEFKGFHPQETNVPVMLVLTDTGVEYLNLDNQAFWYINYRNISGYSGCISNYGSINIYSNNSHLKIHLNFPQDVAEDYLRDIQEIIKEQTSY